MKYTFLFSICSPSKKFCSFFIILQQLSVGEKVAQLVEWELILLTRCEHIYISPASSSGGGQHMGHVLYPSLITELMSSLYLMRWLKDKHWNSNYDNKVYYYANQTVYKDWWSTIFCQVLAPHCSQSSQYSTFNYVPYIFQPYPALYLNYAKGKEVKNKGEVDILSSCLLWAIFKIA